VAITDDGSLCMDGTLYSNPTVDLANVNLLNWKNTQTGYLLQVNSAASTGSTLSLRVHTLNGDVIGNLVGGKTQLLAKCAGPVDGNINIDAANQLFTLAEQRQPATFPPSALTYNQLSGGSLKRYYPAISLLLTVTGENVQVSPDWNSLCVSPIPLRSPALPSPAATICGLSIRATDTDSQFVHRTQQRTVGRL